VNVSASTQNSRKKILDVCLISKPKLELTNRINIWHKQVDILYANRKKLLKDYQIKMHFRKNLPEKQHDVIIVLSRFAADMQKAEKISMLQQLRKYSSCLLWFSERDSAGFTEFEVLPYVDRYLCKHLYKDMDVYNKQLYYNRKFVDFYAKKFNLEREEYQENELLSDYTDHLDKIGLWWNIAFNNVGMVPRWKWLANTYIFQDRYTFNEPTIHHSEQHKDFDLHALFVTKDQRGHIDYHRKYARGLIAGFQNIRLPEINRRIPENKYMDLIRRSKCVFSPFGWGEICYRDFIAFLAGGCLLKPSVEDIHTWPRVLIQHETYVPLEWDLSDLEDKLRYYLKNVEEREKIALSGYQAYMKIWSDEGIRELLDRFSDIVHQREFSDMPVKTETIP
jgi:hypothetical protein